MRPILFLMLLMATLGVLATGAAVAPSPACPYCSNGPTARPMEPPHGG